MGLSRKKMERVAGGARKLFIYDGGVDTKLVISGAGYFDRVTDELDKGDTIIASGSDQTTCTVFMVTSERGVTPVTTVVAA